VPVQFPFGFGLSYATFKFAQLKLEPKRDGTIAVTFSVTNFGRVAGTAVPQIYVGPGPDITGVQQSVRSLRGFERVDLEPGETKRVSVILEERSFQYWSESSQRWVTNFGNRTVYVGDADEPSSLSLSATVQLKKPSE